MARVLYGVTGDTNGHVSRALAIASSLPEHQFYFVGGGQAMNVVRQSYPVFSVPSEWGVFRQQRISTFPTAVRIARRLADLPRVRRELLDLIKRWQPDLVVCDYQFYLLHAACVAGARTIALDHSRILRACEYPVPLHQSAVWAFSDLQDRWLFDRASHNLIVSFFHPPLKKNAQRTYELLPPVLRRGVTEVKPTRGNHVLNYQSVPGFTPDIARQLKRPIIAYGFRNERAIDGNITYKPFDQRTLIEDLASCAYAVINGGHNLICEALYFGKPVFCFPLRNHFEQFLNAWYVRELGYGDFARQPSAELFQRFEQRLDEFGNEGVRASINGTAQVVARVREIIGQTAGHKPKSFTPCQLVR